MRAITYSRYGGPDVLELTEDHPMPLVGPDSVLIRVRAAAVNPVDWKAREGYLDSFVAAHFPVVPGWDVAGVVERLGLDTPDYAVGDEVYGYVRTDVISGGTFAEYVAAPVRTLAHKPTSLTWEEAAGVPLAGLTALQLVRRTAVGPGRSVLVHAAAGGVGAFAVQIALARGAYVIGTASPANHDFLRSLGAEPVAYGDGLVERVRALAPEGVDVILDLVGGTLDDTPALLRAGGTIGSITDAAARDTYGGQYVWARPDTTDLRELAELADSGALRVEVARVYPLEEAAAALVENQRGHTRGKLVIRV
ncbi:NADP-dependent oxidoreductase [Occultella kanbiaonis]|uniref:NADP-dependent oxidoreductase n=1 Tax=Occultella kanbiaonis TaxID=2675754 RepID=UPI0012B9B82B|nr:NADP-dependent oxidoreductase [Occultella kanbiaonis]